MASLNDLDLTKLDTEDHDQVTQKIEQFYENDSTQKSALAYHWERNHLMLDGQQWLVYEGNRDSGGLWKRLQPSPANEYIPRPVTNYLFDAYQTLKGYLLKNEYRSQVRPNSQQQRDKVAAKLAELVASCNWERLQETYNYEYAASCLLTYGTVFKKDFWDVSYTNLARVPRMEERPVVDPNTGAPTGQTESIHARDEQGTYLYDEIPLGDVATAIVEPYRICLDPMATTLQDPRWIMEAAIRPLSWVVENYDKPLPQQPQDPSIPVDPEAIPEQEPGYTGLAKTVKPEKSMPTSLRRFFQMKTSPGIRGALSPSFGTSVGYGDSQMIDEACIVKEYYERPTAKNPHGRMFVVANGVMLYAAESPYWGDQQGKWHPYTECRWEIVPGRFWGKSPLDNAVELQKQINSIDSLIVLNRKTMAVPQKLIPRGTMPVSNAWTGQPGQKIYYTPGAGGEKPENIMGQGLDASVFQERAQRLEDFKQITGAADILKGDRPPGVTAYSALSLLFEIGTGKLYPILNRWKKFVEESQKNGLRLVAHRYREPRPEFINMLRSKNSELTESQIKDFIGKDLYDNCNVQIEADSIIPKLIAAEKAKLMEMAQLGTLNLENPANKNEFNERMGIQGFDSNYSKDAKRAEWENDLLDNMLYSPDNKPIRLVTDNDEVHNAIHGDRTKEPSFMELPFEIQQAYFAHIQEHDMAQQQQQQMQMMQAMAMGTPPPPPAPNPMQQEQSVGKGKGISSKTQHALSPEVGGNPFSQSIK